MAVSLGTLKPTLLTITLAIIMLTFLNCMPNFGIRKSVIHFTLVFPSSVLKVDLGGSSKRRKCWTWYINQVGLIQGVPYSSASFPSGDSRTLDEQKFVEYTGKILVSRLISEKKSW